MWIIDEAQNLPAEFFRDFPAFLNFAFDSRDLISVWLIGHPALAQTLDRAPYAALASRIQVRVALKPVVERERFGQLVAHALKSAGCQHTLLADSGMELLRQASKGLPRQAGRILCRHAPGRPRPEPSARRDRAASHRGAAMNIDLDALFPDDITDETVPAIADLLNELDQSEVDPLLLPHPRLPSQAATRPVRPR